jgi:hypothetical protein
MHFFFLLARPGRGAVLVLRLDYTQHGLKLNVTGKRFRVPEQPTAINKNDSDAVPAAPISMGRKSNWMVFNGIAGVVKTCLCTATDWGQAIWLRRALHFG